MIAAFDLIYKIKYIPVIRTTTPSKLTKEYEE
jgi:hypothetical protein